MLKEKLGVSMAQQPTSVTQALTSDSAQPYCLLSSPQPVLWGNASPQLWDKAGRLNPTRVPAPRAAQLRFILA